jgi:type II secretory pathway pseudopilin PulG
MIRRRHAFTLIELLVMAALLCLLVGLLLPAVIKAKEWGRRAQCLSQLHQLNLSLALYAEDHDRLYPDRQTQRPWPLQLRPYYLSTSLRGCPSDPRPDRFVDVSATNSAGWSYSMTGFGDPDLGSMENESWSAFIEGPKRGSIPESALAHPSETILFGETQGDQLYVELKREPGNFLDVLDFGRHGGIRSGTGTARVKSGGANHAYADGSVRVLDFGKAICPINLWGVTDYYRTNYALCFF